MTILTIRYNKITDINIPPPSHQALTFLHNLEQDSAEQGSSGIVNYLTELHCHCMNIKRSNVFFVVVRNVCPYISRSLK